MKFVTNWTNSDNPCDALKLLVGITASGVALYGCLSVVSNISNPGKPGSLGYLSSGVLLSGLPMGCLIWNYRKSVLDLLEDIENLDRDSKTRIKNLTNSNIDLEARIKTLISQNQTLETDANKLFNDASNRQNELVTALNSANNQIKELEVSLTIIPQLKWELSRVQNELNKLKENFDSEISRTIELRQAELNLVLANNQTEHAREISSIEQKHRSTIEDIRSKIENTVNEQYIERYSHEIMRLNELIKNLELERDNALNNLERCQNESLNQGDLIDSINHYKGELNKASEQILELTQQVTGLSEFNKQLQLDLVVATKPRTFPTNEFYAHGNLIIKRAYEHSKIVLDGVLRTGDCEKQTYSFYYRHTDKNSQPKPINQILGTLNADHDYLKQTLDVEELSVFSYDAHELQVKVSVVKQYVKLTRNDIERYWEPKTKFNKLAINNHRFRITGASEAAKSPTARNILGAKFIAGQRFKIYRFDPSGGSDKDFWRIKPTWSGYDETKNVTQFIKDTVDSRKDQNCSNASYIYFVLDEIDNCMANVDSKTGKAYANAIKTLYKEGSHLKVGFIISGQSPMASNYPNFHRADFNNGVDIHIGSNIKDYLLNSNEISGTTELALAYDKLYRYCHQQNQTINQVSKKFRFALIGVPQQPLYLQELPFLGANDFDAEYGSSEYDFEYFDCDDYPDNVINLDMALAHHQRSKLLTGNSAQLTGNSAQLTGNSAHNLTLIESDSIAQKSCGVGVLEATGHNENNGQGQAQNVTIRGGMAIRALCPNCKTETNSIKDKSTPGKVRYRCLNQNCSRKTFTISSP